MGIDRLTHMRKLYAYLSATRKGYLAVFEAAPWDALVQDRGASFGSIRDVFVHMMGAHRGWFEYVLQDRAEEEDDLDAAKYASAAHLRTLEAKVDGIVRDTIRGLDPKDLATTHVDAHGDAHTTEAILLHMVEEELQHRGEINAMLWQAGFEPPVVSYTRWARPDREGA